MAQNDAAESETSPLIISEAPTAPRKVNCCRVLREEFRLKNFCFDFHDAGVFYKSQWRWPRLVFVVFRLSLAIYTGTICILTITYFPHKNPHRPWPVWLTNWSYLMLTCHEICSATIAVVHLTDGTVGFCCRDVEDGKTVRRDSETGTTGSREEHRTGKEERAQCYMKLDWLLFVVASTAATIISVENLINLISDPAGAATGLDVKGINNHLVNGLVVLLEFCIAALPVRLLHVIYPMIFYCLYFLFSVVFWSVDHDGNVLYPGFIDWNDPGTTVKSLLVLALVLTPICQILFFAVYRLKLFIYSKIFGGDERSFEPIYDY